MPVCSQVRQGCGEVMVVNVCFKAEILGTISFLAIILREGE